jgi:hypothetical protein
VAESVRVEVGLGDGDVAQFSTVSSRRPSTPPSCPRRAAGSDRQRLFLRRGSPAWPPRPEKCTPWQIRPAEWRGVDSGGRRYGPARPPGSTDRGAARRGAGRSRHGVAGAPSGSGSTRAGRSGWRPNRTAVPRMHRAQRQAPGGAVLCLRVAGRLDGKWRPRPRRSSLLPAPVRRVGTGADLRVAQNFTWAWVISWLLQVPGVPIFRET